MLQQFFDAHFHIEKLTKYFSFLMCFFLKKTLKFPSLIL